MLIFYSFFFIGRESIHWNLVFFVGFGCLRLFNFFLLLAAFNRITGLIQLNRCDCFFYGMRFKVRLCIKIYMCVFVCSFFVALIPRKPKVLRRDKHAIKKQKLLPDIRPARCSKFLYTCVYMCVCDFLYFLLFLSSFSSLRFFFLFWSLYCK